MSYTSATLSERISAEPGLDVNQPVFDRSKVRFDRREAAGDGVRGHRYGCVRVGRVLPGEHGVQVAGVPAQRDGQGFEGAGAAATLRGVAVQLPDDRLRDVSALGEIALTLPSSVNRRSIAFATAAQSSDTDSLPFSAPRR
jgi:hypothetical protein